MNATDTASQPLDHVPEAPENCSEQEAALYYEKAAALLAEDRLFAEDLEDLLDLCSLEIWEGNLRAKRRAILDRLALEITELPHMSLKDPEGFAWRVDGYLSTSETLEQAYQKAEDDYQQIFGASRYASYDSYRISRAKRENNPENSPGQKKM